MQKKFYLLCFVFALLMTTNIMAQEEKTVFKNVKMDDSGGWGGYRQQFGEMAGQSVQIPGFHLTGEYERKFLMGYNFNWVASDIDYRFEEKDYNLRFNWHSLQLGYMLAAHRAIHPVVNLDLGIGRVKARGLEKDRIFLLSPSAGLEMNLYRWFHVAIEGGYRAVTDVGIANLRNSDFSGLFGMVTLKFGWSDEPK